MRTANTLYDTALSGGGSGQVIQTITATASIPTETTYLRVDATSGNVTVNLAPLATYKIGDVLMIKRVDASGNTVTIDADGSETIIYGDPLPGVRLDVQRECLANHPLLMWGLVNPAVIVHDCGPNGVRLLAESWEHLHAVCQPTGSRWDVFIEAPEAD